MKKFPLYLFVLLVFTQCMPVKEEKLTEINYDIQDVILQKIHNFQDQRKTDSLLVFFDHKDPTYRYAAAMAMASVQDDKAIEDLAILLTDEIDQVRIAAAYSLGQTGSEKAEEFLINAFQSDDSLSRSKEFNNAVLEAVGKSASPKFLDALSTISTYTRKDTLLLEGQARGIYRYALRQIVSEKGTSRMLQLISDSNYPESVQYLAASYLSRARDIQLDSFSTPLTLAMGKTNNPQIEMELAIALSKTKSAEALQMLKSKYRIASDYRVKCNILRALNNFEYPEFKEIVLEGIKDKNINVALSAGQLLTRKGSPREAVDYWRMAKDTSYVWQVRSILYRATNKHLPPYFEATKGKINTELRQVVLNNSDPYQKAGAMAALSEFGWNYRFIGAQGLASSNPIVRTASADAMSNIANYPEFEKWFGNGHRRVKRDLAKYFQDAISSGDVGMMYVASEVLSNKKLDYKSVIDSTDFLTIALNNLSLPKDIETYNALKKATNYLTGKPEEDPKTPDYNNSVNWNQLTSISDETRAVIVTEKGRIILQFFLDQAPASVINFIKLSKTGYYDGKRFHRVVPNFVVQDGCPRGDGYGGAAFSLRSELPMLYYDKAGYVGMASAGKDTEGTQWFITHRPTPHLDGKYTIFAEVVEGLEIVHQLAVGDRIDKIIISN